MSTGIVLGYPRLLSRCPIEAVSITNDSRCEHRIRGSSAAAPLKQRFRRRVRFRRVRIRGSSAAAPLKHRRIFLLHDRCEYPRLLSRYSDLQ